MNGKKGNRDLKQIKSIKVNVDRFIPFKLMASLNGISVVTEDQNFQ